MVSWIRISKENEIKYKKRGARVLRTKENYYAHRKKKRQNEISFRDKSLFNKKLIKQLMKWEKIIVSLFNLETSNHKKYLQK